MLGRYELFLSQVAGAIGKRRPRWSQVGYQGLPGTTTTRDYYGLPEGLPEGLPGTSRDYQGLPEGLPGTTRDLLATTRGCQGLPVDYHGLPGITRDYPGIIKDYQGLLWVSSNRRLLPPLAYKCFLLPPWWAVVGACCPPWWDRSRNSCLACIPRTS